jgi:glutathione S-transferase
MAWVDLVTLLAVAEFFGFAYAVGLARQRYGIKAPATSGHEIFERYFRVQQNTLEMLMLFVPSLWIAAHYWNPNWSAIVGAVYIVGRAIYFRAYIADPSKRTLGFVVGFAAIVVLWLGGVFGALRTIFS